MSWWRNKIGLCGRMAIIYQTYKEQKKFPNGRKTITNEPGTMRQSPKAKVRMRARPRHPSELADLDLIERYFDSFRNQVRLLHDNLDGNSATSKDDVLYTLRHGKFCLQPWTPICFVWKVDVVSLKITFSPHICWFSWNFLNGRFRPVYCLEIVTFEFPDFSQAGSLSAVHRGFFSYLWQSSTNK